MIQHPRSWRPTAFSGLVVSVGLLLPGVARAQTVAVSDGSADPGGVVQISISVDAQTRGFAGSDFTLQFGSVAMVGVRDVSPGAAYAADAQPPSVLANGMVPGQVHVGIASVYMHDGPGALATIALHVAANAAPGPYQLVLAEASLSDMNGNLLTGLVLRNATLRVNGPPAIHFSVQPAVSAVTATSATVGFATDAPSTAVVNYGVSGSYGLSQADPTAGLSHTIALTGLTPGTTYHYQAIATPPSGAPSVSSGDLTFTTGSPSPPQLLAGSPSIVGADTSSATIAFASDQPTTAVVNYGLSSAYGSSQSDGNTPVTAHAVKLAGLNPGTTYHFNVVISNATGSTTSTDATFMTLPIVPKPVTVAGVTITPSATGAVLAFTTDVPATASVMYGTTTAYGQSAIEPGPATGQAISLGGLAASTLYHYQLIAVPAEAASYTTTTLPDATFMTAPMPPGIPPVITPSPPAVEKLTTSSATISFSTDRPTTAFVLYGTTTGYGSTQGDSALSTSHAVALKVLSPGTTYHFYVLATAADGGVAASPDATFTTLVGGPQAVLSVLAASAMAGEPLTVLLSVDTGGSRVSGLQGTLMFGPAFTVASRADVALGALLSDGDWTLAPDLSQAGALGFQELDFSGSGFTGQGIVLKVAGQIPATTASGTFPLTLSDVKLSGPDGRPIAVTTADGTLTVMPPPPAASPKISIAPVSGPAGSTVTVEIDASDQVLGIAGADITVGFDAQLFTLVTSVMDFGVQAGPLFPSAPLVQVNGMMPGEIRIGVISTRGSNGPGALLTFPLAISSGTPAGTYPLTLKAAVNDQSGIALSSLQVVSGTLTVGPATICGDLNGNGKVDVSDATTALRIAIGLSMPTTAQTAAACGHAFNVAFATMCLRAAVGLGAVLPAGGIP